MSTPWGGVPAASFEFGLADHVGSLAFFVVGGLHRDVNTSFGTRDAVRASLVMLDGNEAGNIFEDVLLFNSRIVARLRNVPGQIILCRIALAAGKGGNNAPVELLDATPADTQLAGSWHSYYPDKLEHLRQSVMYSWQTNENKAQQQGGVQSQPHPTHAGSRTPANNWGRSEPQAAPQATQQQPQQQPGWAPQPAAQPAPPAPPWATGVPAASPQEAGF
jgi:hypothetical protein